MLMEDATQSRFRQIVRTVRSCLSDEKDCVYIMHTPIGIITVSRWNYFSSGFVAVMGEDEHKKFRFVVFSDEQACSFPLEVKRKKLEPSKGTLGFAHPLREGTEDEV